MYTKQSNILNAFFCFTVSTHLESRIDFNVCANMCYVSRDRFNHIFKAYTGASPKEYCLNLKIERAKQLLYDSGMTTAECSEILGFGDVNYFRRVFKKRTGITPKEFLKGVRR